MIKHERNDTCTFQFDVFYRQRSEAFFLGGGRGGGVLKQLNPEHNDNLRQLSKCFDRLHVFTTLLSREYEVNTQGEALFSTDTCPHARV